MKIDDLVRGIEILRKYHPNDQDFAAGDDCLYLFTFDKDKYSPEDLKTLEELGFFEADEADCWQVWL